MIAIIFVAVSEFENSGIFADCIYFNCIYNEISLQVLRLSVLFGQPSVTEVCIMGVWGWILTFVLGIAAFLLGVSFLFNTVVYWVAARYSEKTIRKYTKELEKMLPGANCGGCGCKNCKEYARAVFDLEKDTDCCVKGSPEQAQLLNEKIEAFQKLIEKDTQKEKQPDYLADL